MIKVLFLIHDLGQGGAEKVLVNLVNNMDKRQFDITVMALFGGGVNEQFLNQDIKYVTCFKKEIPGNSKWMKIFSPKILHKVLIKDTYDIEVSYLEGPSARVISGCTDAGTKLLCWIHSTIKNKDELSQSFRNHKEAIQCYQRFDRIIAVSEDIKKAFVDLISDKKVDVLYNTVESDKILKLAQEKCPEMAEDDGIRLVATGSLKAVKAFDRLLHIAKQLKEEKYKFTLYILGKGPLREEMESYIESNRLNDVVKLLGYKTNPYKYVARSDIFVCSSLSEGFSTAATEALILGVPVCTVEVSGMKEMLGQHNEYGVVVDNDEEKLFEAIKTFMQNPKLCQKYKLLAKIRGSYFDTSATVHAVENMLLSL